MCAEWFRCLVSIRPGFGRLNVLFVCVLVWARADICWAAIDYLFPFEVLDGVLEAVVLQLQLLGPLRRVVLLCRQLALALLRLEARAPSRTGTSKKMR